MVNHWIYPFFISCVPLDVGHHSFQKNPILYDCPPNICSSSAISLHKLVSLFDVSSLLLAFKMSSECQILQDTFLMMCRFLILTTCPFLSPSFSFQYPSVELTSLLCRIFVYLSVRKLPRKCLFVSESFMRWTSWTANEKKIVIDQKCKQFLLAKETYILTHVSLNN